MTESYEDLVMSGNADPPADNTQPVASEPQADAVQSAEADSARTQDDLQALLDEFDAQQQQQPQPQPDLSAELEQARAAAHHDHWRADFAEQQAQQVALQAQQERDLRDARELVKDLKGDLPILDNAVGFWLDGMLQAHPELMQIWNGRATNPVQYQQATSHLARELRKTFSRLPDPELTENKMLVTQAVRGASTSEPTPNPAPNLGMMDDRTYRQWVRENLGFDAGV